MDAEVWSSVANTATRFGNRSVSSKVLEAFAAIDWFADSVHQALETGASCNACGRLRDREGVRFLKFLTNEIRREAKFVRFNSNDFHRSRRGDKRFESAENCTLAYGGLCSVPYGTGAKSSQRFAESDFGGATDS
jgi:hypothetical protein